MEINIPEGKEVVWVETSGDLMVVTLKDAPPPWYGNLGKGKLCWVWDEREDSKFIAFVTEYCSYSEYPFRTINSLYAHATPLTPDEIKEFTVCSN